MAKQELPPMPALPNNSYAAKEKVQEKNDDIPSKKLQKVVSGKVTKKEKVFSAAHCRSFYRRRSNRCKGLYSSRRPYPRHERHDFRCSLWRN